MSYNKQRLHKAGYFRELLATNPDIDEGLGSLLRLCESVVRLGKNESALVRSLERDSLLVERVERLITIPAVGPITALTWALEVGDVQRFSSIKKAISYCGLCGAEKSSGNTVQRTPLSKQRNKHLQTTLIEAAKMAPRNSPELTMLYDKESKRAMRIAQRWRWQESWWPTSWPSIVESVIFNEQRRVAASPRSTWQRTGGFFGAWPARSCR